MVDEYFGSVPEDVVALLACHQFQDAVVRVVGVGSVGTRCYLALLTDADGSPLFLQMKEASASVVEAYFPRNCAGSMGAGWWRASASCKPAVTLFSGM